MGSPQGAPECRGHGEEIAGRGNWLEEENPRGRRERVGGRGPKEDRAELPNPKVSGLEEEIVSEMDRF